MSDELPIARMRVSYGERHYEIRWIESELPEHQQMRLVGVMQRALNEFHAGFGEVARTAAETRRKIYALAADHPELLHELKGRELL